MNSDDSTRNSVTAFSPRGTGHPLGWKFGACNGPQFQSLGRRMRRVRGLAQWVCAACAKAKDAQRAAA